MFLVNSRYPRLAATPSSFRCENVHPLGHTLSRSYGINLQSSFTRVLSSALVFSTYLPVSVCGTDTETAPPAAFLGSRASAISPAAHALGAHGISGCARLCSYGHPYVLEPGSPTTGSPSLLRPRWFHRQLGGAGMFACFPSPTPVGLGLGPD